MALSGSADFAVSEDFTSVGHALPWQDNKPPSVTRL